MVCIRNLKRYRTEFWIDSTYKTRRRHLKKLKISSSFIFRFVHFSAITSPSSLPLTNTTAEIVLKQKATEGWLELICHVRFSCFKHIWRLHGLLFDNELNQGRGLWLEATASVENGFVRGVATYHVSIGAVFDSLFFQNKVNAIISYSIQTGSCLELSIRRIIHIKLSRQRMSANM